MKGCRRQGAEGTEQLKRSMASISTIRFVREEFKLEVQRLRRITNVSEALSEDASKACEVALHDLTTHKAGVFFKALTMLPTVIHVLDVASAFFEQRAKDRAFELELDALLARRGSLKPVTQSACLQGRVHMPAVDLVEHAPCRHYRQHLGQFNADQQGEVGQGRGTPGAGRRGFARGYAHTLPADLCHLH